MTQVVEEGTIVTVKGRFHTAPFEFEEMRAPHMEIPLASVKIANRAAESQQPANEPFGQSGTRCALFDQDIEEPFGVGEADSNGIPWFKCQVNGPREAGRYNFSVALLGSELMNDWKMNMGEAQVTKTEFLADHHGVSFMIHHIATVSSVSPSRSGLLGGARITIRGRGFSNERVNIGVIVAGDPCVVQVATMSQIECVLAIRGADQRQNATTLTGNVQPGARGVRRRIWYGRGCTEIETLRADPVFLTPDVDEVEQSKFESEVNVQYARGDTQGPHMAYTGFFRAPVSGNYTFILAADDYAQLRVASVPNAASADELLIDFRSWVPSRAWDREQSHKGVNHNPIDKVEKALSLQANRKVQLQEGDFLYLDAHYRSCGGGDNFALGVIQHNSTINRKDSPAAMDEKQFIDITMPSQQFEVQKITLSGANLMGSFRLSLGGKSSRDIGVNASESEVAAAVRELLSNCEGDNGLAEDPAGNSFECFSERGLTYRGLASTTVDGEECIRWAHTPYNDPWLAVVAGLDGNLCRNPDFRQDGPWCVNSRNQKRLCAVPRCGGTEEQVKLAPALATFEDEEISSEELLFTASSQSRDGVTPKIVKGNAFCGEGALYMHNAWGMIRNYWRQDGGKDEAYEGAGKGTLPFGTQSFPFMCMAYRIPKTTKLSFLLRIELRDKEGILRNIQAWKTLYLTATSHHSSYRKVGTWSVIADDEWHYDCLDLQYTFDTAAEGDSNLFFGQDHLVDDIIFYTHEVPRSTYARNDFYIDEFSISRTPRMVKQTRYPQVRFAVRLL